eukprot:TRINITY_DN22004_c0_g1_i1.p1 TRINITY_DN22004_c0_g1~~TRINITY_DN22004_c0_g1_i1.p1  ORF type:complete len:943 (-),score=113.58 TRINITY_DN22004_c0_g1_i1:214-2973(-)
MVRVFATGSGIVPFSRPGSGRGYQKMARDAARAALEDARAAYRDVGACVCAYNYAAATAGQSAMYDLGMTGVPVFNVNNNCSSGSSGIFLGRNLILSGQYDVVLCVGFEEMDAGLSEPFPDRASPTARQFDYMYETLGIKKGKVAERMNDFTSDIIKLFSEAGREYCEKHTVGEDIFAEIAAKNRLHGQHNENAMMYSKKPAPTAKQIAALPKLYGCLTAGMAAPTGDGAAALVLCSERWVRERGLEASAVEILGQSLVTDIPEAYQGSAAALAGVSMAEHAAREAYSQAGIVPDDISAVELHDCFSPNELLLYEALQLTKPNTAAQFWSERRTTTNSHGVQHVRQGPQGVVVNPSGGLESKGHPIGATGVAQAAELISQLRRTAGKRQMEPSPRVAVQHNFGFNGGAVVTVWGAPVSMPRRLTAPELDGARKFSRGWGSTDEFALEFLPEVHIQGKLPHDLRGTFFRNGPGIMEVFGTPLEHPIDGDGLVGKLTFHGDGRASFESKFVETATRTKEQKAQKMLFHGQMATRAPTSDFRFRDPSHTNVFHWAGKLLACHEYALPHELDPMTLKTLGPTDLGGIISKTKSLCAHYRYDLHLDRLVTVSFRAQRLALGGASRPSQLHICEFDRSWKLQCEAYHEIPGYNYCHDLVVTPSYYIVHQTPFVKVDLEAAQSIMSGESLPGEQMKLKKGLPCRLILIPRFGGSPIPVDLPEPCHVYHFGHAIERGGLLEIDFVALGANFNMEFQHKLWLSNSNDEPGLLVTARVDLTSFKCVAYRQSDPCSCEFPAVHPGKHVISSSDTMPRYTYLMANDGGCRVPYTHVVKADKLWEGRQSFHFEGCSVGEPCFAPRPNATAEDDGYVIVQVFNPEKSNTSFAILDAVKLSAGPVCTLDLQRFLPNAFHGTWCDEIYSEFRSRL